jgi:hypothetical protein
MGQQQKEEEFLLNFFIIFEWLVNIILIRIRTQGSFHSKKIHKFMKSGTKWTCWCEKW